MKINKIDLTEGKQDIANFKKWIETTPDSPARYMSEGNREAYVNNFVNAFNEERKNLKAPYNDYYYWIKQNDWNAFTKMIADQGEKKASKQREKDGAKLIYSDNDWKVYEITTYEASVKYGANTKWCISGSKRWSNGGSGMRFWNDYTKEGVKFYFFINKDTKYALALYPNGKDFEIFDAQDNAISYIPNAPIIDSIPVDYYTKNDDRLLMNLIKTGQLPNICEIVSGYLLELDEPIDIFPKSDFQAFLDTVENNINPDWVRWRAVEDGIITKEQYEEETGEEWDDYWGGDTTMYMGSDLSFLDGYATVSDAMTKDNPYFDYNKNNYFISDLYNGEVDCREDWVGVWLYIRYNSDIEEDELLNYTKNYIRVNNLVDKYEELGLSRDYLLGESLDEHLGANVNEEYANNIDKDILDTIKNPLEHIDGNTKCSKSAGTMLNYYFYETDKPLKLCLGNIALGDNKSNSKNIAHVWIDVDGKIKETRKPNTNFERVLVDELVLDRNKDLYTQVEEFLNKPSLREELQDEFTTNIKTLISRLKDYDIDASVDKELYNDYNLTIKDINTGVTRKVKVSKTVKPTKEYCKYLKDYLSNINENLKESSQEEVYYRGYDSRYGVLDSGNEHSSLYTWITDEPQYALEYAEHNEYGKVAKVKLTCSDKEIGSVYDLGEDVDYYDIGDEAFKEYILDAGLKGYGFTAGVYDDYCICISKDCVKIIDENVSLNELDENLKESMQEVDSEGNHLTKEQVEFFKNSKVRDRKGRLLVCYHGTDAEFDTFDTTKMAHNGYLLYGKGFYFTLDSDNDWGKLKKKCYLNISNPMLGGQMYIDYCKKYGRQWYDYPNLTKELKQDGYDGIIAKDTNTAVVFEPNQIKSIDNKTPSNSDNINEQLLEMDLSKIKDIEDGIPNKPTPTYNEASGIKTYTFDGTYQPQYVEEYTRRGILTYIMDNYINNKDYMSDDMTLYIEYNDGSTYYLSNSYEEGKFKKNGIKRVIEDNGSTYSVYGDWTPRYEGGALFIEGLEKKPLWEEKDTIEFLYHGSPSPTLNLERDSTLWLAEDYGYAMMYGDYLHICSAHITNILEVGSTDGYIRGLIPTQFSPKFTEIAKMLNMQPKELLKACGEDCKNIYSLVRTKQFRKICMDKGYDAVETEEFGNVCYGVFNRHNVELVDTEDKEDEPTPMNESKLDYTKCDKQVGTRFTGEELSWMLKEALTTKD